MAKKEKKSPRWLIPVTLLIALISAIVTRVCKRPKYLASSPADPD